MLLQTNLRMKVFSFYRFLGKDILFMACYASFIYYLYDHHQLTFLSSFNFLPVGILATILSVFLAFHNNSMYDRWWESRRLWGELVNQSRTFAMQLAAILPDTAEDTRQHLLRRHLAFINLLRMQLRNEPNALSRNPFLADPEKHMLQTANNAATATNRLQAVELGELARQKVISDYQLNQLLGTLGQFYTVQGGCERIKNTPFPRQMANFIRLLLWILILVLPIYLLSLFSNEISQMLMIPLAIGLIIVICFASAIGETLEHPFANRIYDIPMTALCETIARDILPEASLTLADEHSSREDAGYVLW